MRIYDFDPRVGQPVPMFQSRAAQIAELGEGKGESHAFLVHFDCGGVIGPHPAEFGQLFAPMEGSGWIEGGDGMRHAIHPGQVAFVERGEMHAKGSDGGMTALMIQIRDFTPLRLAVKRAQSTP
jgi:quercetin dioxygenase-like cupin family protein